MNAYLDALRRLMVLEEQPAWAPHIRSKATLRSAPERHFVDPSLAAAALAAGPEPLQQDLRFLGFLFESLVVRDLRVYSQPLDGVVHHYRDSSGLEVDAVVQTRDGRWAAFEVELGAHRVDEGAAALKRFAVTIEVQVSGRPACLGVVTSTGFAYRRPDGVDVIPIDTLVP